MKDEGGRMKGVGLKRAAFASRLHPSSFRLHPCQLIRRRNLKVPLAPGWRFGTASFRKVVVEVTGLLLLSVTVPGVPVELVSDGFGPVGATTCGVFDAQLFGAEPPSSLMTTLGATRLTQPAPPPVALMTVKLFTSFRKPV